MTISHRPTGTIQALSLKPTTVDTGELIRWLEARCKEALADEAAAKESTAFTAEAKEQQAFGEYLAYSRVLNVVINGFKTVAA